jgi:heptose I phosphotransferase
MSEIVQLYLQENLKQYFSNSTPLFNQLMALNGNCFRHQNGRMTQQIILGNKSYFIKQHTGVGWKEIFKNLTQLRWPIVSAKNELQAMTRLHAAGVATPKIIGYGKQGINPARLQSFILMEELTPIISLEELCAKWIKNPPAFTFKIALIKKVAEIARTLHQNGINHRDFYICHFLLDTDYKNKFTIYLIDLHRAQVRNSVPQRWIIKDLASLYFSCKDIGLTTRDLYRFIKIYRNKPLKNILNDEIKFWRKVERRGSTYRDRTQ